MDGLMVCDEVLAGGEEEGSRVGADVVGGGEQSHKDGHRVQDEIPSADVARIAVLFIVIVTMAVLFMLALAGG